MDVVDLVRAYYVAIDTEAYDDLRSLLASEFVQYRPDRTLSGRGRFVEFMRDERPQKNTVHAVDAVYEGVGGAAVQGRVLRDGDEWFGFIDVFEVEADKLVELRTYTN